MFCDAAGRRKGQQALNVPKNLARTFVKDIPVTEIIIM